MKEAETKCLIWNEENPKLINKKFIPIEGKIEKPLHRSMSQIRKIKKEQARKKNGLLEIEDDVKDTEHDPGLNYVKQPGAQTT